MLKIKKVGIIFLFLSVVLAGCAGTSKSPNRALPPPPLLEAEEVIKIVYPTIRSDMDRVFRDAPRDSVFILGHVTVPGGILTVNRQYVEVHPDGGWLAWIGLDREEIDDSTAKALDSTKALAGTWARVTFSYRHPSHEQVRDKLELDRWFFRPKREWYGPGPGVVPYPVRLEVTSSNAKIRNGWPGTYDLFPPEGTVLMADSVLRSSRSFYRVPLGAGEVGWIEDSYVLEDTSGSAPGLSTIYMVLCSVKGRKTEIRVPLKDRLPFRIKQVSDQQIELTIYGARSWTDVIRQPFGSRVVDEIRWSQVDPTTYKLTAFIRPGWMWGYDTHFDEDGSLVWTLHEAPRLKGKSLKGLTVMIDPGHGGTNLGAVGPTEFTEKEANLELSKVVIKRLEKKGATIIPTRGDDSELSLVQRVQLAKDSTVDLLLSLHYNALGQGVNPNNRHGTSVHYYNRHAKFLAESLYEEITESVGWAGDGLRYQDLALARPTFCPAVLIENAYLMHPEEEALAKDPAFRKQVAKGIAEGLADFVEMMAKKQREYDD